VAALWFGSAHAHNAFLRSECGTSLSVAGGVVQVVSCYEVPFTAYVRFRECNQRLRNPHENPESLIVIKKIQTRQKNM
jgi:hypothetical protein